MPSLLKDIRDAAIDAKESMASVLRKCAVLGSQLNNHELRDWAMKELNGYGAEDALPDYRIVGAPLQGHLAGPFQSGFKNVMLPAVCLPEELQEKAQRAEFREGIASLESMISSSTDGVTYNWPGNLIAWIQSDNKFDGDLVPYAAWQTVSTSTVAGMVDTVRNKVLEFCLRLQEELPDLMSKDNEATVTPGARSAANQAFHQIIVYGDNKGNIASGSSRVHQVVKEGDLDALLGALNGVGVPPKEVESLEAALLEEVELGDQKTGPKTGMWFKRAKAAVSSGAWSLLEGVTIDTIKALLRSYMGIPPLG